jgi:hypothetical protein
MNIAPLLNQSVSWQAVSSTDDRDDPTYANAVTLAARKVQRLKDLIGRDGEVTTATNQITLPPGTAVAVGDLLDGREVIAITSMVTVQGATIGLMALTR